jgi:uncharacterized protein YraI
VKKLSLIVLILLTLMSTLALGQAQTSVFAEAIQSANLRSGIGTETDLVGEIVVGTRYPVIAQSEFFPWLLLGDVNTGEPIGWVFKDLVTVYGDLSTVPFSEQVINAQPSALALTPTPTLSQASAQASSSNAAASPQASPTPQPSFTVSGTTSGEVNIRYRPDPNAERLGVAQAGDVFEITGYHTQFPWVQVAYPASPNGQAWIAIDLLQITGDVYSTRAISTTNFNNLPTIAATSAVRGESSVQREGTPVPLSAEFEGLGNQLWQIVLNGRFDPITSRFGSLYLLDLQTGEEIIFGNEVAFSGTSINKVGILVELFAVLNGDPDPVLAADIANMMICSENVATNKVMEVIGGGDVYAGAEGVTNFLRRIGLQRTFLTAPYEILNATPVPPTRPIQVPKTNADQVKANPNVTNQMTVDEMGYLLGSIYQCAFNESGPLLEDFEEGIFTPQECRKMLHVMSNNNVDALLKAGVPETVTVAHKHGWVADTHGNAAIFFTPGGDYVLVSMLHQPGWLEYQSVTELPGSLPVLAEISRAVYNWYNPDAPLDEIREGLIPDTATCQYRGTPLVNDLVDPLWGLQEPEVTGDIVQTGQ